MKLGIIGYRNHALRLRSIIEKKPNCRIDFIYHPTKKIEDNRSTNNFSDLLDCDAIFISSPNATHFSYIRRLRNFKGYIFCEKPPATSRNQLNYIEKLPLEKKRKLFFNFNYRFSKISKNLESQLNSTKIGKIIQINIITTQGLAFKKIYSNSWRADGRKNLHNLLDTVAIHFLDMVALYLGAHDKINYLADNFSGNGSSYDTSHLLIKFKKGPIVSIFNSYASSYINEIMVVGTNGYFACRDDKLIIRSPRNTFNSEGLFISPPIKNKKKFSMQEDYNNSLINSIDYFLHFVRNKDKIPINLFQTSISTNRIIINLKNKTQE